jgi:hypothetical protein
MSNHWSRRTFLVSGAICGAGWSALAVGTPVSKASVADPAVESWFPQQDPARVKETVGVSHGNFERVRELVTASPALAKAEWDWGFGDWESALGAASHTGNHEIARFLIDQGARPTLFSAAMMGQLAVVRAFVESQPGVQRIAGPHGIPLSAHARSGGEPALEVLHYLESLGDAGSRSKAQPLDESERQKFVGHYKFGSGPEQRIEVYEGRRGLMIRRADQTGRGLIYLGENQFHPAGAESVRIRFVVNADTATEISVHDPDLLMRARRVQGRATVTG